MIGYVTLGTNDLQRAIGFYEPLLNELGAKRIMESDTFVAWATSMDHAGLALTQPFDGNPATVGNGTMVAFQVDSTEKVDQVHARALELGADNEGAAGPRSEGFYAGYFRDPDGNKLNVFYMAGD